MAMKLPCNRGGMNEAFSPEKQPRGRVCLGECVFQRGAADMAAVERGRAALAFGFNDCRSPLSLLPVIAF